MPRATRGEKNFIFENNFSQRNWHVWNPVVSTIENIWCIKKKVFKIQARPTEEIKDSVRKSYVAD